MARLNQVVFVKENWRQDPQAAQYIIDANKSMKEQLESLLLKSDVIDDLDQMQSWQLCVQFAFPRVKPLAWQNGAVLTGHPLGATIQDCVQRWGRVVTSWDKANLRSTGNSALVICPFNPDGPEAVVLAARLGSLASMIAPALAKWLASPQNR